MKRTGATRGARHAHDFEEFLGDVQYPADKRALSASARRNQAPERVRQELERLPEQTYPDLNEVRRVWTQGDEGGMAGSRQGAGPGAAAATGQTSSRPTGTRR